jgi:hypothetical protein
VYIQDKKSISAEVLKVAESELNIKQVELLEGEDAIKLDINITPELKEESEVRDVVRKIQEERKKLGLNLTQMVDVRIEKLPESKKLVQWMLKKAQISNIEEGNFEVKKSS